MKQPKALYLLSSIQMWKFFSHFGMRALLVLFMVDALRLSDARSFGMNAVFLGIVELSGIFGGIVADRLLGLRRACTLGAVVLAVGYSMLIFQKGLYLALPMIILGACLFAGNITALLGQAYGQNDPRRAKGFTFFYVVQNLGALVSTLLCGFVAQRYGYGAGFALAATGMMIGAATFYLGKGCIKGLGEAPPVKKSFWQISGLALIFIIGYVASAFAISLEGYVLPFLPWITVGVFIIFAVKLLKDRELPKVQIRLFLIYLVALILFFAVEDQICSSLIIFAERVSDRTLWGWTLPSSVLMSINPVIILILGAFVAKMRLRLSAAFLLTALSFGALAIICLNEVSLSIFGVMGIVSLISIAELIVGPVVYSFASEVASKGKAGTVMGMLPIAFALAYLLSGKFSKWMAVSETSSSLFIYGSGFGKIALVVLAGGILLEFLMKRYGYAKSAVS